MPAHPAVSTVVLVRHGETEWSRSGRHTGHTDLPLTTTGRAQAEVLRVHLPDDRPDLVLTSPLQRAAETARLMGLSGIEIARDLTEWDYGEVEGRTTADMRAERPGWDVWRDGVTGGESIDEVALRADRVITRCRGVGGACVLVAHGHLLRVLAARWLGLAPDAGRFLRLDAGHWSRLAWERETPVLAAWNVGPPRP
ncbi:MAG: histidine phosphatase family protein [Acidimicrobiales bacterium]